MAGGTINEQAYIRRTNWLTSCWSPQFLSNPTMLSVELAIVFLLTLVNGLLAMSELAIVSSRPARLRAMIERDVVGSRRALALASDPGRFLSTVQIGITLVGVLSGAFSGATLGLRLTEWLMGLGVPDRIADVDRHRRRRGGDHLPVAHHRRAGAEAGRPAQSGEHCRTRRAGDDVPRQNHVAAGLGARCVRDARCCALLGQHEPTEDKITEDEIRTLVAEAEHAGVLEPGEKEMIAGVMRLGDAPVRAVMTPRREVDMVGSRTIPQAVRAAIMASAALAVAGLRQRSRRSAGRRSRPRTCCTHIMASDHARHPQPRPSTHRSCPIPSMHATSSPSSRALRCISASSSTSTVTSKAS